MTSVDLAQLARSLRILTQAAYRVAGESNWMPMPGSEPYVDLQQRYADVESRLLAEAALHSQLQLQAEIEHVAGVAALMRTGASSSPRVLARAAIEAGTRICHSLDPEADRRERATRRLLEWNYANYESQIRLEAAEKAGLVISEEDDVERTRNLEDLERCLTALGFSLKDQRRGRTIIDHVGKPIRRLSTLAAVEGYLAGESTGLPSFLSRGDSAHAHGTEVGLLSHTVDSAVHIPPPPQGYPPHASPEILLPKLASEPVGTAAISFALVPTALVRSLEVVAEVFGWDRGSRAFTIYLRVRDELLELWQSAQ